MGEFVLRGGLRDAVALLEQGRDALRDALDNAPEPSQEPEPEVFVFTGETESLNPAVAEAMAAATANVTAARKIAAAVAAQHPDSGAQLLISALGSGGVETNPRELLVTMGRAARIAAELIG